METLNNEEIAEYKHVYPPFSVAMCVYGGDNPEHFRVAVDSVINQSVSPDEIILVVDGPVPNALDQVISEMERCSCLYIIRLDINQGLGVALKVATENCKNDIIARMDSDDIAHQNRFETQLKVLQDSDVDIVGGDIIEFIDSPDDYVAKRCLPVTDSELKEFIKHRCPFNHMTVMFRKNALRKAGGYISWHYNEDYYLWIRMMLAGCTFANTGTALVNVRVGEGMYARRGGWKYFCSEAKLQGYMLKNEVIGLPIYIMNVVKRFVVQVMLPNRIRGYVFKKYAREKYQVH